MSFIEKYLPIVSLIVGTSALSFQVFVLAPWHYELDDKFKKVKELKAAQDKKLQDYNAKKMDKIYDLQVKVNELIQIELEKAKRAARTV